MAVCSVYTKTWQRNLKKKKRKNNPTVKKGKNHCCLSLTHEKRKSCYASTILLPFWRLFIYLFRVPADWFNGPFQSCHDRLSVFPWRPHAEPSFTSSSSPYPQPFPSSSSSSFSLTLPHTRRHKRKFVVIFSFSFHNSVFPFFFHFISGCVYARGALSRYISDEAAVDDAATQITIYRQNRHTHNLVCVWT